MGIGDPGGEELIGGKQRLGAGALEHDRDRSGGTRGLGSGQQGSLGRGTVHGDLGPDKNLYRELTSCKAGKRADSRSVARFGIAGTI